MSSDTITPEAPAEQAAGGSADTTVQTDRGRAAAAPPPPQIPGEPSGDRPRSIGGRSVDERAALWGSLAAALALVWVLYEQVLAWTGSLGFFVCFLVVYLALYAGVTALGNPLVVVVDRLAAAAITWAAVIVGGALAWVVISTFWKGWAALSHPNFFTHDMFGTGPQDPFTKGGVLHAIVGSAIQVGIAAVFALPLGVGTAVYLTEVGGRGSMIVRTVVEAMTALPDIIAGLFVYVTVIVALGVARSGIAVSAALFIMMLPIIARSSEVQLRVVPGGLREAGLALGASRWATVRRVVLPTARSGLATALILGIARAVGETAPVLIVSAATTIFNANPLPPDPMTSLPLFTYFAVRSGEPVYETRGFGAASILLAFVLLLFVVIRFLARDRGTRR